MEVVAASCRGCQDGVRKKQKIFDSSSKTVLEFKASLIAARFAKERRFRSDLFCGVFKNIQPISVGV